MSAPLLSVDNLTTVFPTPAGVFPAVDRVSFDIARGETVGLVGESGCGKSMTALSLIRLVPRPGRLAGGRVLLDGVDLTAASAAQLRQVRGRRVGMVFQDPMSSLNPTLPVGLQIAETMRVHLGLSRKQAHNRAVDLLGKVGIPDPRERVEHYPHQFSGGMRQRVMIAIAISCDPVLLLADEATTGLDVTIQAQILELLAQLSAELGTSILFITHDLGLAAGACDRMIVMYAGQIVESGVVDDIFEQPRMPYTRGLFDSVPGPETEPGSPLRAIPGAPPDLLHHPPGCRFEPRCAHVRGACGTGAPGLSGRGGERHEARCFGTEEKGWIDVL